MIQKQSGANTVDIVHEIQKRLPDIQASLPRDVKMETIFEGIHVHQVGHGGWFAVRRGQLQ